MLIEGAREAGRALSEDVQPVTLFVPVGANADLVGAARDRGAEIVEVAGAALDRLAVRGASSPVLVARRPSTGLEELTPVGSHPPLYLVAEAIEKPGNLGAMIRTADGAGVDGLIVADQTVDPFGPNVIRASLGAVFSIPLAVASSVTAIEWLEHQGVAIVATTPDATTAWSAADLTGPVACVVGAEHDGLSDVWLDAADVQVSLPMRGIGDSLNAATTAAILAYEAVRQRSH